MLDRKHANDNRPTIFCLHYLGGSAREWSPVERRLAKSVRVVAIDLPGFGSSRAATGYSVAEMAAFVADTIRADAPRAWLIAGHSMGAKVAAAVARNIEDGEELDGLAGLILVAGSPPSPEPMDEAQRDKMIRYFSGDAASNRADAQNYVAANSEKLDAGATSLAVDDALRAQRAAWVAWLERGSREDWSQRIGVLATPALVVAGADDENLGPVAQQNLTAPHFANVRLTTVPGVKHLIPLEATEHLARLMEEHVLESTYAALIASNRVSAGTRKALETRGAADDPAYAPAALDSDALATLRAVMSRVIPQSASNPIDLAARIDRRLGSGDGDGWRFALLPADADAYRIGLRTLNERARQRHASAFTDLEDELQDGLLNDAAAGTLADAAGVTTSAAFDAAQMRAWFEEVCADAVKAYMLHPDTLARFGYSGIANGGDGGPKSGFARVGIDEREPWEPVASSDFLA